MNHPAHPAPGEAEADVIRCDATEGFRWWTSQAGGAPAVTPDQASRVAPIGLRTGGTAVMLGFTAACTELYDVQSLPGAFRPMILHRDRAPVRQAIPAPGFAPWIRPGSVIPTGREAG